MGEPLTLARGKFLSVPINANKLDDIIAELLYFVFLFLL